MVTLNSIAEEAWRQIGSAKDEARIPLGVVQATALNEYSYQLLLLAWKERRDDGYYTVPSEILSEADIKVVNNEADISNLPILRSLPWESYIQGIDETNCDCKYIKSTVNLSKILCDDDSLGNDKTFYLLGNKMKFPKGAHSPDLKLIYANDGSALNGEETFVSEAVGALVRQRLIDIYLGKTVPADTTNNSNPNG